MCEPPGAFGAESARATEAVGFMFGAALGLWSQGRPPPPLGLPLEVWTGRSHGLGCPRQCGVDSAGYRLIFNCVPVLCGRCCAQPLVAVSSRHMHGRKSPSHPSDRGPKHSRDKRETIAVESVLRVLDDGPGAIGGRDHDHTDDGVSRVGSQGGGQRGTGTGSRGGMGGTQDRNQLVPVHVRYPYLAEGSRCTPPATQGPTG